ncbi:hypothetical protein, partial [Pseudomonas sp. FW305-3-2-15-C-LB1]|uniref:hypothetical protein n=1 Tax=Pseudomonas sp. FW305-3-2-15-C-LB1 TaxID=2751331 RepID=UPI001C4681B5
LQVPREFMAGLAKMRETGPAATSRYVKSSLFAVNRSLCATNLGPQAIELGKIPAVVYRAHLRMPSFWQLQAAGWCC